MAEMRDPQGDRSDDPRIEFNDRDMDSMLRMVGRVRRDKSDFVNSIMERIETKRSDANQMQTGNDRNVETNVFSAPSLNELAAAPVNSEVIWVKSDDDNRSPVRANLGRRPISLSSRNPLVLALAILLCIAAAGGIVWWQASAGFDSPGRVDGRIAEADRQDPPVFQPSEQSVLTLESNESSPTDEPQPADLSNRLVKADSNRADAENQSVIPSVDPQRTQDVVSNEQHGPGDEELKRQTQPSVAHRTVKMIPEASEPTNVSQDDPYGIFEVGSPGKAFVVQFELAYVLDENGMGAFQVDGRLLETALLPYEASEVVRRLGRELSMRVRYMTPKLGDFFAGSISFVGKGREGLEGRYEFAEWRELAFAFHQLQRNVTKIVPNYDFTLQINRKKRTSVVEDMTNELLGLTTKRLRRAAIEMVENRCQRPAEISRLGSLANFKTISIKELEKFASGGELKIPATGNEMFEVPVIQTASAEELQNELNVSTPEIALFKTDADLRKTIKRLGSHTERGRVSLKRNEILAQMNSISVARSETRDKTEKRRLDAQVRTLSRELKKLSEIQRVSLQGAGRQVEPVELLPEIMGSRSDLDGLALVMGDECKSNPKDSLAIEAVSGSLGEKLSRFNRFSSRHQNSSELVRQREIQTVKKSMYYLLSGENERQRLETMDQMLITSLPEIRKEMVRTLAEWNTESSVSLISCYAKYDLSAEVRAEAVSALSLFPQDQVREQLLPGLEYPLPSVARNSAEAIVRLNDRAAVPELVKLLSKPDPRAPTRNQSGKYFKRELVAINHLKNCLLCHADSQWGKDPAKGIAPEPGRELPVQYYHNQITGFAVRADITYLRQDFSVIQPVKNSDKWPMNQRFDYVVQDRPMNAQIAAAEAAKLNRLPNEYHEIIGQALRLLTSHDPVDNKFGTWKAILN